jgi:hypothetical protein
VTARPTVVVLAIAWWALVTPGPLGAQPAPPPAETGLARVEIAAGVNRGGAADLGSTAARLTSNPGGPAFVLFETDATYSSPLGGQLRFGYRLAPWLVAGVSASLARGDVTVSVRSDAEGAAPLSFAGESLSQGQVEGRVDLLLTRFRFWDARVTPHVSISGGVFRHWHEGNVLIESGEVFQAGAGVRYALVSRPASRLSRLGILAEVRMTRVHGGFHWGRETRTVPAVSVEFYTGWGR